MNRICFNRGKNICLGYVAALLLCMLVSGCDKMEAQEYIPQAPDYSDSTFWYTEENDKTGKMPTCFILYLLGKRLEGREWNNGSLCGCLQQEASG